MGQQPLLRAAALAAVIVTAIAVYFAVLALSGVKLREALRRV
jgi:hypothetical protein